MLYVGSYCRSLRGAWRTTDIKILIVTRVFLQMYRNLLEMKCLGIIRVEFFDWTLVLLEVPGMS